MNSAICSGGLREISVAALRISARTEITMACHARGMDAQHALQALATGFKATIRSDMKFSA
jgi:phosphotransferase system HPr-like phosphotransfer protein